ncbi:TetR/AcrR family transcriptional regulator [Catenulispora sp. NF23]|uniref:TetR/AcrR family transcriptional regulator n=1 Tax=Catenulispora pinistramenti TaxID=2705254 RepID=A0ABS5KGU0_9ACTN|nr:TetR/AcrR family transcriptional regulator [Catenulispora pinistramenti]MBS2532198.1 TetR/AcrR family transcriptional regulator [Catenulispora pinistramenti]MBS2545469.1 TetR/AcrR family transcriptional regulator [Catenulispora pinistramenti]
MTETRPLRRDARDNIAKLQAAALEVFLAKGLDASLDEIARTAGVSIGTLYNRFGSREGLIDAVIPEVAGSKLLAFGTAVLAKTTPRERLEEFVTGMIDLQGEDPALNDAILRRYPDAVALLGICDRSIALGQDLVRDAHADGSLSPDFTEHDLFCMLWLAGIANRDPHAPANWQRVITRALDQAWTVGAAGQHAQTEVRGGSREGAEK